MDSISAKLIRIASRLFDSVMDFRFAAKGKKDKQKDKAVEQKTVVQQNSNQQNGNRFSKQVGNVTIIVDGLGIVVDKNQILIQGNAHISPADGILSGYEIMIDEDGFPNGTSFTGNLDNCTFIGGNNTVYHGTFIGEPDKFKNGKFGNDSILAIYPDKLISLSGFTGRIMTKPNGKAGKDDFISVKNATFEFKSDCYLVWTSGKTKDKVPFPGEYNGIVSTTFAIDGKHEFTTSSQASSFSIGIVNKTVKVHWKSGGIKEGETIEFNGDYGCGSNESFTGEIKLTDSCKIKNGSVRFENGKISHLYAKDCKYAIASSLTEKGACVGKDTFDCENASFKYDGAETGLMWLDGKLTGGKTFDCHWKGGQYDGGQWMFGFWETSDKNWISGTDSEGTFHKAGESPRTWEFEIGMGNEANPRLIARYPSHQSRYDFINECLTDNAMKAPKEVERFGRLIVMLRNQFTTSIENTYHVQRIEGIYSTGVKVIFENKSCNPSGTPPFKPVLSIVTVEMLDCSTLATSHARNPIVTGFDETTGEFIFGANHSQWRIPDSLKKRAMAISDCGAWDNAGMKGKPSWFSSNPKAITKKFNNSLDNSMGKSSDEMNEEFKKKRIWTDAMKYITGNYQNTVFSLVVFYDDTDNQKELNRILEEERNNTSKTIDYTIINNANHTTSTINGTTVDALAKAGQIEIPIRFTDLATRKRDRAHRNIV